MNGAHLFFRCRVERGVEHRLAHHLAGNLAVLPSEPQRVHGPEHRAADLLAEACLRSVSAEQTGSHDAHALETQGLHVAVELALDARVEGA